MPHKCGTVASQQTTSISPVIRNSSTISIMTLRGRRIKKVREEPLQERQTRSQRVKTMKTLITLLNRTANSYQEAYLAATKRS